MFLNCKQTSYEVTCLIYEKVTFFHFCPTDLVNTCSVFNTVKTTVNSAIVYLQQAPSTWHEHNVVGSRSQVT